MADETDQELRPRTFGEENQGPLENFLAREIGAAAVTVRARTLLSGGAISENWHLAVEVTGGELAGTHDWVLRTDAAARMAMSLDRDVEFEVIAAAHAAGVPCPRPVAVTADTSIIGAPFMVVGRLQGNAQARKLVRDPGLPGYGEQLAGELGRALARLHQVTPTSRAIGGLPVPQVPPARHQVALMRTYLDGISEPRPALEYVLSWLLRNAPEPAGLVLCHGDFRTGNVMVEGGRLTGLLDWEFAQWSDRHLDVGWFSARCWRFGAVVREAGGIGSRAAFHAGYDSIAAGTLDPEVVPYWEIMAAARWAVVALLQGERHITGGETSLELALTGLMAPEMEYEALRGIIALEGAAHGA